MKNNIIITILEFAGAILWVSFFIIVIVNNWRFDIQPTNSQVLVLILLYMMLNVKKVNK